MRIQPLRQRADLALGHRMRQAQHVGPTAHAARVAEGDSHGAAQVLHLWRLQRAGPGAWNPELDDQLLDVGNLGAVADRWANPVLVRSAYSSRRGRNAEQ